VLAGLLRRYINEEEPDTEVVFVDVLTRVVAFAIHGSSGYTGADNVTPMWIGMELCVGLARLDCGDGILLAPR
jgi:hypothetical protein